MIIMSQAPTGALSATCSRNPPLKFKNPNPPIFSTRKPKFPFSSSSKSLNLNLNLTLAKAVDGGLDSAVNSKQPPPQPLSSAAPPSPLNNDPPVFVGGENMPLEGVIQFDKPSSSARIAKWGKVALLAGGDVLALVTFAAIGRFTHGFPVFDFETLRTADPFIAGWFLSAYFLGGFGEDGRGINGMNKAVTASAKSWALGIPLGIGIRALSAGHIPSFNFVLVSIGSTAVLLLGWRTLLYKFLPSDESKKSDVYRRGSPFELFELLTSLVRRW